MLQAIENERKFVGKNVHGGHTCEQILFVILINKLPLKRLKYNINIAIENVLKCNVIATENVPTCGYS